MRSMKLRLLSFLMLAFCSCGESILHDLDEFRANQVKVALAKRGISSKKIKEGTSWRIEVEKNFVTPALGVLEDSRILRRSLERKKKSSSSLIKTREERQSQISEERAESLEQTLESVPGVLEAHVHIHMDKGISLPTQDKPSSSSASVLLIIEVGKEVSEETVKKIISGATGISSESVSMIVEAVQKKANPPIKIEIETSKPIDKKEIAAGILVFATLLLAIYVFFEKKKKQRESKAIRPLMPLNDAEKQKSAVTEETSWGAF